MKATLALNGLKIKPFAEESLHKIIFSCSLFYKFLTEHRNLQDTGKYRTEEHNGVFRDLSNICGGVFLRSFII